MQHYTDKNNAATKRYISTKLFTQLYQYMKHSRCGKIWPQWRSQRGPSPPPNGRAEKNLKLTLLTLKFNVHLTMHCLVVIHFW